MRILKKARMRAKVKAKVKGRMRMARRLKRAIDVLHILYNIDRGFDIAAKQ